MAGHPDLRAILTEGLAVNCEIVPDNAKSPSRHSSRSRSLVRAITSSTCESGESASVSSTVLEDDHEAFDEDTIGDLPYAPLEHDWDASWPGPSSSFRPRRRKIPTVSVRNTSERFGSRPNYDRWASAPVPTSMSRTSCDPSKCGENKPSLKSLVLRDLCGATNPSPEQCNASRPTRRNSNPQYTNTFLALASALEESDRVDSSL